VNVVPGTEYFGDRTPAPVPVAASGKHADRTTTTHGVNQRPDVQVRVLKPMHTSRAGK
jgi:hypothetical protein